MAPVVSLFFSAPSPHYLFLRLCNFFSDCKFLLFLAASPATVLVEMEEGALAAGFAAPVLHVLLRKMEKS